MIRSRGRRLGALFLLTAFLTGGYGLSDLDAFLFHSSAHPVRADVSHVDQPGGCGAHAERCVLALSSARPQQVAPTPVKLRLNPVASRPFIAVAPIDRSVATGTLQLPRAPPRASAR